MNANRLVFLPILFLFSNQLIAQKEGFEILPVDDNLHRTMVAKNVFGSHSPVAIDRLKLIKVRYFGFDKKEHDGEIMVLDACSQQVMNIFMELHERKFLLNRVALITEYGGSDSLSMADNNTSGHNLRAIIGGKRLSLHAYGTAIDINPINNPFVKISCSSHSGIAKYEPVAGIKYANRMENRLGKANREGMAEQVVDVFAKNGFYWWGGYWNCPIDYQHFQVSRSITDLLVAMDAKEATDFFKLAQEYYNKKRQPIETLLKRKIGKSFTRFYKNNKEEFYRIVGK